MKSGSACAAGAAAAARQAASEMPNAGVVVSHPGYSEHTQARSV